MLYQIMGGEIGRRYRVFDTAAQTLHTYDSNDCSGTPLKTLGPAWRSPGAVEVPAVANGGKQRRSGTRRKGQAARLPLLPPIRRCAQEQAKSGHYKKKPRRSSRRIHQEDSCHEIASIAGVAFHSSKYLVGEHCRAQLP